MLMIYELMIYLSSDSVTNYVIDNTSLACDSLSSLTSDDYYSFPIVCIAGHCLILGFSVHRVLGTPQSYQMYCAGKGLEGPLSSAILKSLLPPLFSMGSGLYWKTAGTGHCFSANHRIIEVCKYERE